jgi:hypothetical protein
MPEGMAKSERRELTPGGWKKLEELENFKSYPSLDSQDGSCGRSVAFGINEGGQPELFREICDHIEKTGHGLTKQKGRAYTKRAVREYEQSVSNLPNSSKLSENQFDALTCRS